MRRRVRRRDGVKRLTAQDDDKGTPGKAAKGDGRKEAATRRGGRDRPRAGDVGETLRNVYQRTIDEDIPPEMLDLLGKLG